MVYVYGGFLKWWYPTTMGFPTKNDHFGDFWGVKWGYHHVRKHQYMYCQTAKTHGETNPFASKKNRGLQAVREWQVFICIVGRSFGSSVGECRVYFPPQKKRWGRNARMLSLCCFCYLGMLWISFFLIRNHMKYMNPLATQNLMHFSTVPLLCTCCFPRETIGYFLDFSKYGSEWPARGTCWSLRICKQQQFQATGVPRSFQLLVSWSIKGIESVFHFCLNFWFSDCKVNWMIITWCWYPKHPLQNVLPQRCTTQESEPQLLTENSSDSCR